MVKKILSLDGGGIKGVLVLQFLKRLEEIKNIRTCDYFDLFAGTSTGGLIATLFSYKNMSATEILESVYTLENIQKIMCQTYSGYFMSTIQFRAKYSDTEKIEFIEKYIGTRDIKMKDVQNPLLLIAYNPMDKVPIFFRSYFDNQDYILAEACNATSAAPTYFPIAKITCPNSCTHKSENAKSINSLSPIEPPRGRNKRSHVPIYEIADYIEMEELQPTNQKEDDESENESENKKKKMN